MSLWGSRNVGLRNGESPVVLHDADHVQLLRLMVTDTYRWKCDWADWRIRFEFDAHTAGLTLLDVTAFLHQHALPLCSGAEVQANVLYLRDEGDLAPIYDNFGRIVHGLGHFSAIQSRAGYEDAVRIAAWLAERRRPAASSSDPLILPDLQWQVTGSDQHRIARTRVGGREIVVRFGFLGNHEMWVVDVDGRPNCAHFRARADAMSKLGVGVALESFKADRRRS